MVARRSCTHVAPALLFHAGPCRGEGQRLPSRLRRGRALSKPDGHFTTAIRPTRAPTAKSGDAGREKTRAASPAVWFPRRGWRYLAA